MKKVLIAGTSSGVGKTTISIGLMLALKKRKLKVQPFKVGPDYIDTSYHNFVTGRKSRNLDSYMLTDEVVKYLFNKNSKDADISVIEGVMGLYDGYGTDINDCTSSYTSKLLKAPVILIIDGSKMATSAAAMVLGYKNLDPKVHIGGVIVNNLSSQGHFEIIKASIEKYTSLKVLGYVPKKLEFSMPSRHLGLVPTVEMNSLEEKFEVLAEEIEKYINVDEILKLSESEEVISDFTLTTPKYSDLTIAVAYDKAFNFYYWDNIDLLKDMGAKIVTFSPIEDKILPKCDGIYIGGGFPEIFSKELEVNKEMRNSIKECYEKGVPIYAECGGLMYLGETIEDIEKNQYHMVGILKGKSVLTKSLQRFGYVKGIANKKTLISDANDVVLGHEFHHSKFISTEPCVYEMVKEKQGEVVSKWLGGYSKKNVLATYLHIHFYSNVDMAIKFLNKVSEMK